MGKTVDVLTPDALMYHLVDRVLHVSDTVFKAIAEGLRELDLSEPQANLLWHLDPNEEPPVMNKLAGMLYCDPSTVTFLVTRLEEHGLVTRQPNAHDRRARVVSLTKQGLDARRQLVQVVTASTPLSALTLGEREHLLSLLTKAVPLETQSLPPDCFG